MFTLQHSPIRRAPRGIHSPLPITLTVPSPTIHHLSHAVNSLGFSAWVTYCPPITFNSHNRDRFTSPDDGVFGGWRPRLPCHLSRILSHFSNLLNYLLFFSFLFFFYFISSYFDHLDKSTNKLIIFSVWLMLITHP